MPPNATVDGQYSQLVSKLIASGEWYRLKSLLAAKLNENGWLDSQRDRSKGRLYLNLLIVSSSQYRERTRNEDTVLPGSV
jgi:hypothetical protein